MYVSKSHPYIILEYRWEFAFSTPQGRNFKILFWYEWYVLMTQTCKRYSRITKNSQDSSCPLSSQHLCFTDANPPVYPQLFCLPTQSLNTLELEEAWAIPTVSVFCSVCEYVCKLGVQSESGRSLSCTASPMGVTKGMLCSLSWPWEWEIVYMCVCAVLQYKYARAKL